MKQNMTLTHEEKPIDHCNLVNAIAMILGTGTLLAYNILITCSDYLNNQFPDYPNVMFTLVPVMAIPNFIGMLLMIRFAHLFSWTLKIAASFTLTLIILLLIPYIVSKAPISEHFALICLLIASGIIGMMTAFSQISVIAFVSLLPTKYIQTTFAGQAVSGIIACIIRIVTKSSFSNSNDDIMIGGLIYFIIGSLFTFVCVVSFIFVKKTAFVQYHINDNEPTDIQKLTKSNRKLLTRMDTAHALAKYARTNENDGLMENENDQSDKVYGSTNERYMIRKNENACLKSVFPKVGLLCLALFINMFITFLFFPSICIAIPSQIGVLNTMQWVPVIMVTEFNIFDFVGRKWISSFSMCWNAKNIWLLSLLRIIVYPVFIVLYKGYFTSDILCHLTMIIASLSNGYINTLCFMWAPKLLHSQNEQQIATSIMTTCLLIGIVAGSLVCLLLSHTAVN